MMTRVDAARVNTNDPASTEQYPFARLRARYKGCGRLLDFSFGSAPLEPPVELRDEIARSGHLMLRAASEDELEALSHAAVAMMGREYGVAIGPESVAMAPSGRLAMDGVLTTVATPNWGVAVTRPSYPAFEYLAARRGATVHQLMLDADRQFEIDCSTLSDEAVRQVRVVGVNYPNNPTGAVARPSTLAALQERLTDAAVIFNDAIYGLLNYTERCTSLLGGESITGGLSPCIEMHSFTKSFGLGPLGIALLIGPPELLDAVRRFGEYAWPRLSALQVQVATRCANDERHGATIRERLRSRIRHLHDALAKLGFVSFPTHGGQYVLCRAPAQIGGRPVGGPDEAAEALLSQYQLAVVPFRTSTGGYLRFSACCCEKDLGALTELAASGPIASP
jgi:aspartate/methionine/tyrosine aminotransferase